MRNFAPAALSLAALALAACSHPTPTPYANAQWGFAATFPAPPKVTETAASATETHSLLAEAKLGDDDFAVSVIDVGGTDADPTTVIDRAGQVLAQTQDLDVGATTEVAVGDINGHEVRFDKDGKPVMLSRLFMINGRLYEVNANSAKGPTDPTVKAFLDSFHFIASPEPEETPGAPANATNAASNATAPATNAG